MALGKADDGFTLYNAYKSSLFLAGSLLSKLLQLTFESIRLRSPEAFGQLFESFSNSLQRDSELEKLLKKIGSTYLGISYESPFNLMNILESMLK